MAAVSQVQGPEKAGDGETVSSLHTRPSLLQHVQQWDDVASWKEFDRLYRKLIYGFARRSGLSHEDAEDVTQEVFKRVAETIHRFESDPARGKFRGWLMNLTRWRIADKFASRPKGETGLTPKRDDTSTRTSTIDRVPDPECAEDAWEREWQRHLIDAACERVARRVKPRHYQAFDLYVRQGRPVSEVSRELGLNPGTVFVIAHRLKKELRAEVEALRDQLG